MKGGSELIGRFVDVKITDSNTWALYGEAVTGCAEVSQPCFLTNLS